MRSPTPLTAPADLAPPCTWQALLDGLVTAACVIDAATQQVLAANPAAEALFGLAPGALPGRAVQDLAATPEDQLFWIEAAHAPDTALHSDSLIRRLDDGRTRAVERRIAALPAAADGRTAWLLSWVDRDAEQHLADELGRLAAELGATLESSRDAILVTDLDGRVRGLNAAFAGLWGLPALGEEADAWDDLRLQAHLEARCAEPAAYAPLLRSRQLALLEPSEQGHGGPHHAVDRVTLADGRVFERRLVPQYGRGRPVGWIQVWQDLSPLLAQEARLRLAAQVFETSLDALLVTDADGALVAANPAACRLCGHDAEALLGLPLAALLADADAFVAAQTALALGRPWAGDLLLRGAEAPIPVQAQLVRAAAVAADPLAEDGRVIVVLRDQRERLAQQHRLRELAETDLLTGLANRLRLEHEIQAAIERRARSGGGFALLMIGLERLEQINDSLGHGCGDRVLVEMARRLGAAVRAHDALGRLAGDSFVLLLDDAEAAQVEPAARRLLAHLAEPLALDELRLTVKACAGVALYPTDGQDADTLLRNADSAMHRARALQGGTLSFYRPAMNVDLLERIQLDHAMRQALRMGDFRLHYQPQVDVRTGRIVGAEALCRWQDPQRGAISPGRFIPVAEETGFIAELGRWVMVEAVAQAARWQRRGLAMPVSVNVSALQFRSPDYVRSVAEVLDRAGLPPELLELELTESILVDDFEAQLRQLHELAALGVRLAIDDFGTGYSSLRYLKRLPIHRLKIDREFIRHLPDDPSDLAITRSIVQLAQALKLQVVAEGVENEAQHACLHTLDCDEFQGFLFSPAVPAEDFERLLQADPLTRLRA